MAGEPIDIDQIVDRVTVGVIAHLTKLFDARYERLGERLTTLETRITELEARIDNHAGEIKKDTRFTRAVAGAAFGNLAEHGSEHAETPGKDTPRPWEVDRATSADPAEGAQRIDLPRFGTVAYIRPGTDREQAWGAVGGNLRHWRGAR